MRGPPLEGLQCCNPGRLALIVTVLPTTAVRFPVARAFPPKPEERPLKTERDYLGVFMIVLTIAFWVVVTYSVAHNLKTLQIFP